MAENVTLEFIGERLLSLTDDVRALRAEVRDERGSLRDDMAVLMAIVQRLDGTMQGLVNEVRAQHSLYSRLERRLGALEKPEK